MRLALRKVTFGAYAFCVRLNHQHQKYAANNAWMLAATGSSID
jgi:hypothetical protein